MLGTDPQNSQPSTASASAQNESSESGMGRFVPADACCADAWEEAYLRFETPAQEIRKFVKRLMQMGAARWPRDAAIVELFCGRGNGLQALSELGFSRLEGVDLSASLLAQYTGPAKVHVGDCRRLSFDDSSKDIVIIQGGLHHLQVLPDDLEQTLSEANRVLRENGRMIVVEPWLTPFLSFVHAICRNSIARRLLPKIEALATMIYYEQQTYDQWLGNPQAILNLFEEHFHTDCRSIAWGKLSFVGHKRVLQ